MSATPVLSVVIPNYRRGDLLRRCLASVLAARATTAHDIEVIVVDDGSGDDSCAMVEREFPDVTVVALTQNRGYAGAVNAGLAAAGGDWVMTLNNDTTVDEALFARLLAVARHELGLGLLAAQQRFSSDPERIYSAGMIVDTRAHASDRLMGAPASASESEPVEVFGACGAAALYRRTLLEQLGGFDERFAFGLEDADVAWRAQSRGWRCLYVPDAIVYHDLGGTVRHGSERRLFGAGRNRWLLIAKNLDGRTLIRRLPQIIAFDLAYMAYACPRYRTLAPLRGRLAGLRRWREMRTAGAQERRRVVLTPAEPLRAALGRHRAWRYGGAGRHGEPESADRSVLFLNQYAPPDSASTGRFAFDIARTVASDGSRVTFLTGQPSYAEGQPVAPARELRDGVELIRVPVAGASRGRATKLARFVGYGSYLARAALVARRLRGGAQTVVCFHNPPLLPLLGALIAGRDRRLVSIVLDIHPDVVIASGWLSLPGPFAAAWDALNRFALRRSDRIAVLSEGMKAVLAEKGIQESRIVVIPLWADPELAPAPADPVVRARVAAEDELLLLLSGNLGITQQLEPLLETARLLQPGVRLCFVGGGVHAERWRELFGELESVTFLPFQDERAYRELVAAADAGIVTLAAGLERLVVPSRAFPLLSAGLPLVAVMSPESELGKLVGTYGCGVCSTDPAVLAGTIRGWHHHPAALREAGRRAREAYLATRDREMLAARYSSLVRATGSGYNSRIGARLGWAGPRSQGKGRT